MSRLLSSPQFAYLLAALFLATASTSLARAPSKRILERDFLEKNAAKPGIVTTKSGLQYEVLKEGDGSEFPKWRDTVSIHIKGTLIDGTVFEDTLHRDRPVSTKVEKLISGCKEAIKLMNVGDKFRFYVPSALGYGRYQQGDIPAYSVLIFEIELFGITRK